MSEAFNLDAKQHALLEDYIARRLQRERAHLQPPAPPATAPKLTKLERKVLDALLTCGRASIREILEVFPEPRPAYTTIQTIVYRLEDKNAVRRVRKISNAHIFEPTMIPLAAPQPNGENAGYAHVEENANLSSASLGSPSLGNGQGG
jgi:hypothetical protein